MSASLSILQTRSRATESSKEAVEARPETIRAAREGSGQFARAQIRSLVHRVFLQGWPRPARQVVFSAASSGLEIAVLCREVGEILAAEKVGRVSLVEGCLRTDLQAGSAESGKQGASVRGCSQQIGPNLWLLTAGHFLGSRQNEHNAGWLCGRLGELRREFDFAVIHAEALATDSSTAFLAHLSDGLVLALEAHRTRRLTALRIREQLTTANVRLLGVVLCERDFPIPEKLYQRL